MGVFTGADQDKSDCRYKKLIFFEFFIKLFG
jgi:hypothetical protein